ncbi:YMR1 [Candida margitis]|uniref:YMR1 n=1 Tax=Candida margitis TaxID=1775924 RepID=UPI00222633CD|nr:YMR1 [Candida margitis]KAI5969265.1 YMR1 [Candida margitis]
MENIFTVNDVVLSRRGSYILGTLILSSYHLVFTFTSNQKQAATPAVTPVQQKEIWICYPIIERMAKSRGSTWLNNNASTSNNSSLEYRITSAISSGSSSSTTTAHSPSPQPHPTPPQIDGFDNYSASNIRLQCKDFTYFSFDFKNDLICTEVFNKLSSLATTAKTENDIKSLYAYSYVPNNLEKKLDVRGWDLYDTVAEYSRLGLISNDTTGDRFWRLTEVNSDYKFCPSYPRHLIVPSSISDNVLKHAAKFRSKQRIPAVVYKHKASINGNVIARCAQPLVGLNLQNRSIQDEKLIGEIFHCQDVERGIHLKKGEQDEITEYQSQQMQRNLLVDLRPVTNAMAQHALGAGTENVDNYRNKKGRAEEPTNGSDNHSHHSRNPRQVDKIFCNIDNIHVVRDSLNKLTTILNDLDRFQQSSQTPSPTASAALQHALTKTQWLNRLSIILQSVDRITKSIHLNNTNVIIHCSDGWDRTSQVSALAQLCLDPYYRTTKGFMVLIEKEWVSFGFKFNTRADHGGCIGAVMKKKSRRQQLQECPDNNRTDEQSSEVSIDSLQLENKLANEASSAGSGAAASVTSFLQKAARAARDIKNSAQNGLSNYPDGNRPGTPDANSDKQFQSTSSSIYGGSNERSPVFHQFLDCVYQIFRQQPTKFEFNTRFLKRLLYHYYSCQYGSFLCDSERELLQVDKCYDSTVSVWDYFNSRPNEFQNKLYDIGDNENDGVVFFNSADMKWWFELYGRSDEEMNGLSNSLDRKFAQMAINKD